MDFRLGRSRLILAYLLISHVAALMLLISMRWHELITIVLCLMVFASLFHYLRCFGWLGMPPEVTGLQGHADNQWLVLKRDGQQLGPYYLQQSVVLGPLAVLYLHAALKRGTRPVLVVRDGVDADNWRRLQIRLRDPESWD